MYFKKLVGTKCYLSPIDINDYNKYTEWWNDADVVRYLPNHYILTAEKEKENLITVSKSHSYSIIDLETNELIGDIGIKDISNTNRTGEISIIIGNKKYWNIGYGKEAMKLLINYAYNSLSLNCINLKVYEKNVKAISCYKSIGFQKAGLIREGAYYNQEYDNIVIMDILPKDFYKDLEKKIF